MIDTGKHPNLTKGMIIAGLIAAMVVPVALRKIRDSRNAVLNNAPTKVLEKNEIGDVILRPYINHDQAPLSSFDWMIPVSDAPRALYPDMDCPICFDNFGTVVTGDIRTYAEWKRIICHHPITHARLIEMRIKSLE